MAEQSDILTEQISDNDFEGEEQEEVKLEPTFTENIIELKHSFGYDCKRLFNLCLIDDDTLIFASGNFLHYFHISKGIVSFHKTEFGTGIGFITKNEHPDFVGLLTIAENGANPTIFIRDFSTYEVRIKLEGGAKTQFTCGSYNSTGELFASQAGYPDFMLTIWKWQKAEVILRSKSFQSNVLHVHFSRYNPILLSSCGLSHIKFWKMARTFTGLKLQGDLGRFGKTDFSDIYAIYMLPDENVISGCEWGNILLWEAGLIKFEICRKGRKPCHTKPITQITLDNGEVTTVGMDGYVRVWFWETVDLADPPDDDRFVEIEPIYEFKVGDCEIRAMQKIKPFDDTDSGYYAQDGSGGIWYCDLNKYDIPNDPRKLYTCHGGKIVAARTSPISPHLMTLGEDGKIFLYNYETHQTILEQKFVSIGTDMIWFNTKISSSGMELIVSFEDGILRQFLLDLANAKKPQLHLVRVIKAHTAAITRISVNRKNTLIASGAADKTVFIHWLTEKMGNLVHLRAIGFVQLKSVPNYFSWDYVKRATVLVGSKTGEVYELTVPLRVTEEQTFLSFNLEQMVQMKSTKFVSVKSRIRRDIRREEIKKRKEKKRKHKLMEVEKLKAANPGLQIDMETALADSEPEEEEEPLHIPAKPNPVLWLRYTNRDTIWVSMGGYDAGYIYELDFTAPEPVRCTKIADGDDCEMHSYTVIDNFMLFGLVTGKLRINSMHPGDFTDLRNYRLFNLHDTLRGTIPKILTSYDGQYLFSIGYDGNVFAYYWNGPRVPTDGPTDALILAMKPLTKVEDIVDPEYPSMEQEKIYAEIKRQEEAAAAHDRKVLAQIGELQDEFTLIMRKNERLPEELQMPHSDLLLDNRITRQIADELQAELDEVREDLAYDLEFAQVGRQKLYDYFLKELDSIPITVTGIGIDISVSSIRLQTLGEDFDKIKQAIEERLRMEAEIHREDPIEEEEIQPILTKPIEADEKEDSIREPGIEGFFFGRDSNKIVPRFSKKMLRLLLRYRSRQIYEVDRMSTWGKMEKQKPDPNKNHPDDERRIQEAERNLGDYKLKIGAEYEPRPNETLTYKYIEIVKCRERCYDLLKTFNDSLFKLRQQKKKLYDLIAQKRARLDFLHRVIPARNHKHLINIPDIDMDIEYPELNLIEHRQPGCGIEIDDILFLQRTVDSYKPSNVEIQTRKKIDFDEVHNLERYKSLLVAELDCLPSHEGILEIVTQLPRHTDPAYFEKTDDGPSPRLIQTRFRWLLDMLEEQDSIIKEVENRVQKFNSDIKDLYNNRFAVKFDYEFMQCYMIALNQELNILRDSEQIENHLFFNADEAMKKRNQAQAIINSSNRQVDDARKQCDRLNEQIASIQMKFMANCKNHKFFDFLRRIFKKKWRAPKPPKGPDESSESSSSDDSSSEDEADNKSVDSLDMTTIRLDETHCPPGLERSTYELAFKLRADRHVLEKNLQEQQKHVETKRAEVKEKLKQMAFFEETYKKEQESLTAFRHLRQQELNKVKIAVVLRLEQIQHFTPGEDYRDLSKAVLFDAMRLSKLRSRIGQLNEETIETRRIHRINIVHLRRINIDLKFMRYDIVHLEELIKEEMLRKFGIIINLDELEEEVLRKYIFELETTAEEEFREIEREIKRKSLELKNVQEELIAETRANTEKLNVLAILQEEKNFLDEILASQKANYEKFFKPKSLHFERDIEKLLSLRKHQREQIECLEREICTLRLKAKPLQLESEVDLKPDLLQEMLPQDDVDICPEMFAVDSYDMRLEPDHFILERVLTIVQKRFILVFGPHMSKDNIRKYSQKVSRYLAQAANSLQGKITERILDCITDNLQTILPKKYLIHLSCDDLRLLFQEVSAVVDYERSEVNTEDVVSGIFSNAMDAFDKSTNILNKTQFVIEHIFKELIEVLPLEEFQNDKTRAVILQILEKEEFIDPKCMSVEKLIENVVNYANDNLLDGITAIPIRHLAEGVFNDLLQCKGSSMAVHCSLGSVASVMVSAKKK